MTPTAHIACNQATREKNTPKATYSAKCSPMTAKWIAAAAIESAASEA